MKPAEIYFGAGSQTWNHKSYGTAWSTKAKAELRTRGSSASHGQKNIVLCGGQGWSEAHEKSRFPMSEMITMTAYRWINFSFRAPSFDGQLFHVVQTLSFFVVSPNDHPMYHGPFDQPPDELTRCAHNARRGTLQSCSALALMMRRPMSNPGVARIPGLDSFWTHLYSRNGLVAPGCCWPIHSSEFLFGFLSQTGPQVSMTQGRTTLAILENKTAIRYCSAWPNRQLRSFVYWSSLRPCCRTSSPLAAIPGSREIVWFAECAIRYFLLLG